MKTTASCDAMASHLWLLLLVLCSLTVTEAQLRLFDLRASNLPSDALGITDGYVEVFCGLTSLGKTSIRDNDANPWWEEEFTYLNAKEYDTLTLKVHDSDLLFDDLVGVCERQMKLGTYEFECFLTKGGTLYYSYTLG